MTATTEESVPIEFAFNPFDSGFMTDPGPVLARARDEAPVFFSPILNSWIVTRYDDIVGVLRDTERFTSREVLSITELLSPEVVSLFGDEIPMEGTLTGVDPPDHTRLRSVLDPTFSPTGVTVFEPMVREVCNELVDTMAASDHGDLLREFAYPLPLIVISRIIGIPEEHMASCRQAVEEWTALSIALLTGVPLDEQIAMAQHILDMHRLIAQLIEQRFDSPRGDLMSTIAAQRHDKNLTPHEMLSLVPGLFLAGHEAPANVIANTLWRLLSEPKNWEAVVADAEIAASFWDETLRRDPSVFGMWRNVVVDSELGGQTMSAGQKLFLVYQSANRDSSHYAHGDDFILDRGRIAPHLAFGRGIHHCIGAPLARIESRVAFEVLARRLPNLRLANDCAPVYQPHPFLRGMAELPATW